MHWHASLQVLSHYKLIVLYYFCRDCIFGNNFFLTFFPRMKQELTEQKRAEERSRREAIFQSYLQKKKEKEISEESPSRPVPPVIRRQRSAHQRGARPKSQPALPAEMTPTRAASGIAGHSSHDNLKMDGVITKTPASNCLRSRRQLNVECDLLRIGTNVFVHI